MSAVPITVVLVHWNQADRCVATIEAFQHQGVAVRLVVVDNGSTPATVARLREVVAAARADRAGRAGAQHRASVRPPTPGSASDGVPRAEGRVGRPRPPRCPPGRRHAGRAWSLRRRPGPAPGWPAPMWATGTPRCSTPTSGGMTVPARVTARAGSRSDYPHGTLLIARRAMFEAIGLFDERYFAYCEETDLGLRAQAAGWEVGLVHGVMVTTRRCVRAAPSSTTSCIATPCCWSGTTRVATTPSSASASRWSSLLRGLVQPSYNPWIFSPGGGHGGWRTSSAAGSVPRRRRCWPRPSSSRRRSTHPA